MFDVDNQSMSQQQPQLVDDIRWKHPSTIMIGGPSGSGKTELTNSILTNKNDLFNPTPKKTLLYFREWQDVYSEWKSMGLVDEFYDTFPDEEEFRDRLDLMGTGTLVIFDDMFLYVEKNKSFFDNLFCINSHHLKVSVVLIVHNLFTKSLRTLSLNCHRFFLTQSLRDKGQLQALARQAYPGKSDFVIQAFDDSMKARYGHICLDFSPDCNSITRVTSNWFAQPTALNCYVYKTDMESSSVKMSPKAFSKLILIPQNRYLKLLSNDCGCKIDDQPHLPNTIHSARLPPRFQSMVFDSEVRNLTPESGKESKSVGSMVGDRVGWGESAQDPPVFDNIQPEKGSASLDPSPHLPQPTPMSTQPSLTPPMPPLPPPPPPNPPSFPIQPWTSQQPISTTPPQPNRLELHQELQKAIAERSSRSTPHFIDRPPPLPISTTPDIRKDLHDELQQAVANREINHKGVQRTLGYSRPEQTAIEYSRPEQSAIEYSRPEQSTIEYSRPEQSAIEYSRPTEKTKEYSKSKTKKIKPEQYTNPTRALENLNVGAHPESNYPISLRSLDPDIAPPVKKTSKIPKRKLLKKSVFSPSPPITDEQGGESLKPTAKKRKGEHLTKPKPTKKKKEKKFNQGLKRSQDFPLKAAKRLTSYPLWKL